MQLQSTRFAAGRVAVGMVLALLAGSALAHPGHEPGGVLAALAHPFTGLDHVLAMSTVGMLAARLGGQARWSLPAAFLLAMLAGALAATAGILVVPAAALESLIAASVLVFGLALALRRGLGAPVLTAMVAGFAVFHGASHGLEVGASLASQAPAFLLGTLCLLALGQQAGAYLVRRAQLGVAGMPLAMSGALLLAQAALS